MYQTITLGRLCDIQVGVHVSWLALYALVTWSMASCIDHATRTHALVAGAVCGLVLFASVVVHEFGHALCARRYGVRTRSITLFLFGGIALLDAEPPSPAAEIAIALAGPLVSLAAAALAFPLTLVAQPEIALIATYAVAANLALAAFNMVPAFPLDGGRVLRAIVWRLGRNFAAATATSALAGVGLAVVLAATGAVMVLSTHQWIFGWYVLLAAFLGANGWNAYANARRLARLEASRTLERLQRERALTFAGGRV